MMMVEATAAESMACSVERLLLARRAHSATCCFIRCEKRKQLPCSTTAPGGLRTSEMGCSILPTASVG